MSTHDEQNELNTSLIRDSGDTVTIDVIKPEENIYYNSDCSDEFENLPNLRCPDSANRSKLTHQSSHHYFFDRRDCTTKAENLMVYQSKQMYIAASEQQNIYANYSDDQSQSDLNESLTTDEQTNSLRPFAINPKSNSSHLRSTQNDRTEIQQTKT